MSAWLGLCARLQPEQCALSCRGRNSAALARLPRRYALVCLTVRLSVNAISAKGRQTVVATVGSGASSHYTSTPKPELSKHTPARPPEPR